MPVFEKKERSRVEPMRRGERLFEFYDSCAREGYESLRHLVNDWVSKFPASDQKDIVQRLAKGSNEGFNSAFSEIMIHTLLRGLSYQVSIHVETSRKTKIDFAFFQADDLKGYIECTSFAPAHDAIASDNREAQIYNAIGKANIPDDCRFGYSLKGRGNTSPNLGRLVRDVEIWATSSEEPRPEKVFKADDWKIELTLLRGFKRDSTAQRIAVTSGEARWISGSSEIRWALDEKAGRYGDLNAPYVIAVADCKGELSGSDNKADLVSATFGDEAVSIVTNKNDGSVVSVVNTRKANGFWGTPDKQRNKNVSAILLIPSPDIWSLRNKGWEPLLLHNPWAAHPLSRESIPITQCWIDGEKLEVREGDFGDLVGAPRPWPPTGE